MDLFFVTKNNKSFHFDSFGRPTDNFLLNQIPKPMIYPKYKIQHKKGRL